MILSRDVTRFVLSKVFSGIPVTCEPLIVRRNDPRFVLPDLLVSVYFQKPSNEIAGGGFVIHQTMTAEITVAVTPANHFFIRHLLTSEIASQFG